MDILLGAAAHAMADHSSPDWWPQRGADTHQCLLPQLLWCMPLHVMFPLPTTSLHLVHPAQCCMCWLHTICTAILAKFMYACYTQHRFLVLVNKTTLVIAGAGAHGNASGLIGGCAHALLGMWVHAYFCNMQRTLGND